MDPKRPQIRPHLHFTPPNGWMNDPNGLIFHNGEYHLFYQHYPEDLRWGAMHWGHAVSTNLIDWKHLPIALYPAEDGAIFSGSIVIDRHNTAGLGTGALVAIYTLHIDQDGKVIQNQGIAYSLDDGRSWSKYSGNPVITMPSFENHSDFRDPKVSWYGTPENGHWTMILAVHNEVWIYTSPDLKTWEIASKFGQDFGSHDGVWECPDLFEMPVEGSDKYLWIMLVSVGSGAPAGGNGVQYFLGNFDGKTFTPTEAQPSTRWIDHGADFYAAVTYNDEPHGRRILIGWMNNWPYSHDIPAERWRGMQSFPRELKLVSQGDDLIILQKPIDELESRWAKIVSIQDLCFKNIHQVDEFRASVAEYNLVFQVGGDGPADSFGVRVRTGENHHTVIGYSTAKKAVYVDRSKMGNSVDKMASSLLHEAKIEPINDRISLNILVDHESIEVWVNNGEIYLTELNFPLAENQVFELFSNGGEAKLLSAICKKRDQKSRSFYKNIEAP